MQTWRRRSWWAMAALWPVSALNADQVVVGARNYPNAKVLALADGRLQFRAADGTVVAAWIDEVDSLLVERGGAFADINEAERLAAKGEVENALIRYRRAARISEAFWGELMEARILRACNRPELVDQAALTFVKVVRGKTTGPGVASRLIPTKLPDRRDTRAAAALEALETAVLQAPADAQRAALDLFRFALLRSLGDPRAATAAGSVVTRELASAARCDRVYALVLAALDTALLDGAEEAELRGLDRFIRDCPQTMLADALLLKGAALAAAARTEEQIIRASWPWLRVAIQMPDDRRVPDALLGAAECMRRIGREDKARQLLQECVSHPQITKEARGRAEAALAALDKPSM